MMRHEAGVKTVAVGGRQAPGPMKATGGTRGANEYSVSKLDDDILLAQEFARDISLAAPAVPDHGIKQMYMLSAGINSRDAIRKGEDAPLHFVYDAADCRIFYTKDTILSLTALWLHAVEAITSPERRLCVANSTGAAPPVPIAVQQHDDKGTPVAFKDPLLDAELQDWVVELGDLGVQSDLRTEFINAIVGSECDPKIGDACGMPRHYQCVKVAEAWWVKHVCMPTCLVGLYCQISELMTGTYTPAPYSQGSDGKVGPRSGLCEPNTPKFRPVQSGVSKLKLPLKKRRSTGFV